MSRICDLSITPCATITALASKQQDFYDITGLDAGTGAQVNGIKKLLQRFVQLLLTRPNTNLTAPDSGSVFITLGHRVNTSDDVELTLVIQNAVNTTAQQMKDLERDDDIPEEQLSSVTINDLKIQDDRIGIGVLLVTQANEAAQFTLDLDTLMSL
jgi:hypothetical protein